MQIISKLLIFISIIFSALFAEVNIGMDMVSRYIWRGSDYGNAAAIQPYIDKDVGNITIGAWGSWSISPGLYHDINTDEMVSESSGNECDLYVSTILGPLTLTLTDYFFPAYDGLDSLFNIDKHTIELSAKGDVGPISVFAAINMIGDINNSSYLEFIYKSFSLGFGNGIYSKDGEIAPVNIGVSAERENFRVSYIINPNQQTSFIVFGVSI